MSSLDVAQWNDLSEFWKIKSLVHVADQAQAANPSPRMVDMNFHAPSLRFSITELYKDAGPNIFL